jgi:small subunit ribosomal protein S7
MPRRRRPEKRERPPDAKYGSVMVVRLINNILKSGKKGAAEKILYGALDVISERTKQDGMAVLEKALSNIKPVLEVRPRRVGGATYQVPIEVRPDRRMALAIRWLLQAAKARPEHTMKEKLAAEIIAASKREGAAVKKREDTHRMAEANKAFAHFRW